MAEAKPPRTAKAGTLLSQWWTLGAIARDERTKGRHMSVAWVIIDRYMQKHGAGRASTRYLEKATGLSKNTVLKACHEMVERGYFTAHISTGRTAEYTPNWRVVHPSIPVQGGAPMCTTVVHPCETLSDESGAPMCTESFLRIPADKPAIRKEDDGHRPPTASAPLAGLSPATAAESAVEELQQPSFESLWRAYGHNRAKKEARAAWNALPVEVDRAAVIRAASEWQASWAAQGKPDAPRFTLARWLKDERFDEDAPRGFNKVERPAKTKAGKSATPAKRKPTAPITARITAADVVTLGFGSSELRFSTDDGTEHVVVLEHPNEDAQSEGQRELKNLVYAVGLQQIADSGDLLGRTIKLVGGEERFAAPDSRPADEPPLPKEPEPVRYANPAPEPPRVKTIDEEQADYDAWFEAQLEDDAAKSASVQSVVSAR